MNRLGIIFTIIILAVTASLAAGYELKNVTYRTRDIGSIVFSHKDHLKQKTIKNNCKACHKEGTNKLGHFTMADMENGKSCGACHNGNRAFAIADCQKCHPVRQVNMKTADIGSIKFDHRKHASVQRCENCHTRIYRTGPNQPVGMSAMEKGRSCGACHNKKLAFGLDNCAACHPAGVYSYSIKTAAPVPFSHETHLGTYKCQDCHSKIFRLTENRGGVTMTSMETGKSCGSCHDGKQAFSVKANCASCHRVT